MPIKRYNGSTQVLQDVKRWNGTAWVKQLAKRWNGTAWVLTGGQLYTWQKWSVKTVTTVNSYKLVQGGTSDGTLDKFGSGMTVATDYNLNNNGQIELSGSANLLTASSGYGGGGSELDIYSAADSEYDKDRTRIVTTTYYSVEPDSTSSQQVKDQQVGTVTSYTSSAYPNDGIQDGYWYIKV